MKRTDVRAGKRAALMGTCLALALVISVGIAAPAQAEEYRYVNNTSAGACEGTYPTCGTQEHPWKKVSEAAAQTKAVGGFVFIGGGPYKNEGAIVLKNESSKGFDFMNYGSEKPKIEGYFEVLDKNTLLYNLEIVSPIESCIVTTKPPPEHFQSYFITCLPTQFVAATYPVTEKAKTTNFHGFEITGAVSICKKGSFNTGEEGAPNPTGPTGILEVHPNYSECEVSIGRTFKAKVVTTGCNYRFHVAPPGSPTGKVDIVCQAGKQIEVIVEGLSGCNITVGSQNGLPGVSYNNESGKVKVNAEVNSIHYKAASACGIALEGSNAKYREGVFTAGIAKLATEGHPASALSEGFTELGEADPVEVT